MRWDDERFVKVYTRDTPDWLALGWEAHALFWELLRKSDRAGLFDSGKSGARGVAAVTGIPVDVVERTLPLLISDGCIEQHGTCFLVRNFIEAQSANQSDKARAQKSRETARDNARRDTAITSQNVTVIENPSRNVVTKCDSDSKNVTPRIEDTRLEVTRTEEPERSLARDPSATATEHVSANSVANVSANKIRPRTAHDLEHCLRVAIQREQKTIWNPGGTFAAKDGREFLEGFGDQLDDALAAIEERIEVFAKDASFAPWTVSKFAREYNGIGKAKGQRFDGKSPKPQPASLTVEEILAMDEENRREKKRR